MKKSILAIMFLTLISMSLCGCKKDTEQPTETYTNTFTIGDNEYEIKHAYFIKEGLVDDDETSALVFTSDEIESENNVVAGIIFNDNSEWKEIELGSSSNAEYIVKEIATDKFGMAISGTIFLDITGETYSVSSKGITVMFNGVEGLSEVASSISYQGKTEDIPDEYRGFLTF